MYKTPKDRQKNKADYSNLAESIKAVAHPKRLELVQLLHSNKNKALSVTAIAGAMNISQPEASKHLLLMKKNGILNCKKQKVSSIYFLNSENPVTMLLVNFLHQNNI